MSLILEKCRNGFLMLPINGQPADAFILADSEVSEAIKQAFQAEEQSRSIKTELRAVANDLADLPVLTDAHMAA